MVSFVTRYNSNSARLSKHTSENEVYLIFASRQFDSVKCCMLIANVMMAQINVPTTNVFVTKFKYVFGGPAHWIPLTSNVHELCDHCGFEYVRDLFAWKIFSVDRHDRQDICTTNDVSNGRHYTSCIFAMKLYSVR